MEIDNVIVCNITQRVWRSTMMYIVQQHIPWYYICLTIYWCSVNCWQLQKCSNKLHFIADAKSEREMEIDSKKRVSV